MYCKECGIEVDFDAKDCLDCGTVFADLQSVNKESNQPQSQPPQTSVQKETKEPKEPLCIAGISLGVISLVFFCTSPFGVVLGVAGLILGIMGRRKSEQAEVSKVQRLSIVIPGIAAIVNLQLVILNIVLAAVLGIQIQIHIIGIDFGLW